MVDTKYVDLSAWQTATSLDANSVEQTHYLQVVQISVYKQVHPQLTQGLM